MTKQLYEDALADVKQLKEVAETNAKRAIIEAVSPRIKMLIEQQLFASDDDDSFDDELTIPSGTTPIVPTVDDSSADAMSLPDEEGKVTLDVDALGCEPCGDPVAPPMFGGTENSPSEEEYILGLEALTTLKPVLDNESKTVNSMKGLRESVNSLMGIGPVLRQTSKFKVEVNNVISQVENMYEYVQERVTDPEKKKVLENKLESYYKKLNELKMNTLKNMLNEDDSLDDVGGEGEGELTLKLTGLPDDVDLSGVGVDLISDESDDDEELEIVDDEGGDEDLGDLDLGGDQGQTQQVESISRLSDDTIVEIDENMLRREIKRMKRLRESTGVDASVIDNFGGGADEGEAFLDGEVTTEADVDHDGEMLDELDDVSTTQYAAEGVQRKIRFEKSIQERLKRKVKAIKAEASTARPSKRAQLQKEYKNYAQKFNASVKRTRSLETQLKEASSRNNSSKKASGDADRKLRAQLAEQNLLNVKLVHVNKLLQNESLSKRQKAQVISKLDEAKTSREVKLVYESLVKTLSQTTSSLSESRQVLGSSSRVTKPGATNVNEGFETDRWATLAGLK